MNGWARSVDATHDTRSMARSQRHRFSWRLLFLYRNLAEFLAAGIRVRLNSQEITRELRWHAIP
jgi:hypothetical protein